MSLVMHHSGVLKLPPGFRFHPTDEELVVQYLRRKVYSCPLPASIIPDVDLTKLNPWDLPGGWEQERYFFTPREAKYQDGKRWNRATGCGYWKATGKDKSIVASKIGRVVGTKKTLVFYRGKAPNGKRTEWVMHEYSLTATHSVVVPTKDWVLCRVFTKKRATKIEHREDRRPSSPSSASDSSCVTKATDEYSNGEDITSPP